MCMTCQGDLKEDSKVVEILPWWCQLMEPRDARLVALRNVDGVESSKTYIVDV